VTNEEYVANLRQQNAKPFIEDLRETLPKIYALFQPMQRDDETPLQYRSRQSDGLSELNRLSLRIQDGLTA